MGINAGAFLGILLCGYIGEKVGCILVWPCRYFYVFWHVTVLVCPTNIWKNWVIPPKTELVDNSQ